MSACLPPHPTLNPALALRPPVVVNRVWSHCFFPVEEDKSSRLPQYSRWPGLTRECVCAYIRVGVTLKDQEFLQIESKSHIGWLLDSMKTPMVQGLSIMGGFASGIFHLGGVSSPSLKICRHFERNWPWCWRVQVWHITASLRGRGLLTWIWEKVLIENPLRWVYECYDFLGTRSCDTGMDKKWRFSAFLPRYLLSRESASPYTSPVPPPLNWRSWSW